MADEKTIADVTPELTAFAQQAALMRVQLYGIMETHRLLGELDVEITRILRDSAGPDGTIDGLGLTLAQEGITTAWNEMYAEWVRTFGALRWVAGAIPFGTVTVLHEAYFSDLVGEPVGEGIANSELRGVGGKVLEEQGVVGIGMVGGGWFYRQLQVVIDAANTHVYQDGLNLSQRIWRLDKQSLEGIMRILFEGVAAGNSAWNISQDVEVYLGAGKDCPRWTRGRLFGLTKEQIAGGDRTGLVTADACAGQGVSYNALRLMRNEIQVVHHGATDMVLGRMPWVEEEEIRLSPSHPPIGCECEEIVVSGRDGTGIYPKGTITLPVHVQCICIKLAVLMDDDEFAQRARGWMTGTMPWAAMDEYAEWLGLGLGREVAEGLLEGMAAVMVDWLWADEGTLRDGLEDVADLAGLEARALPLVA